MKTRKLMVLLIISFFTVSQTGCGKSSAEMEKKAKEVRKGEFHNPPAKSY